MLYSDIDPKKKAFIFELDNVLYPEKDFLFQVYYLFANFLDYTGQIDAKEAVHLMTETYNSNGKNAVFVALQKHFGFELKYQQNFNNLLSKAQLPLPLLLYPEMLALLQDIVVDRKKLFIVTDDNPEQQLNKIKYTDWQGLDKYLYCYFTEEFKAKPDPDTFHQILKDHNLQRRDIIMIGNSEKDEISASAVGIDYLAVINFLS